MRDQRESTGQGACGRGPGGLLTSLRYSFCCWEYGYLTTPSCDTATRTRAVSEAGAKEPRGKGAAHLTRTKFAVDRTLVTRLEPVVDRPSRERLKHRRLPRGHGGQLVFEGL